MENAREGAEGAATRKGKLKWCSDEQCSLSINLRWASSLKKLDYNRTDLPTCSRKNQVKRGMLFSKQCLALSGTQWVLIQWILFRFRISLSTIFHDVRLTLQDALWNIIAVATQCHDGVAIRSDIIWSASSGCCYPAVAYRIPMMLLIRELLFRNSRNRFGKSKKFEMRSFAH